MVLNAVWGCVVFLLTLSGVVYILNDIADAESDRRHPSKKHRPIASGRLSKGVAFVSALVVCVVSLWSGLLQSSVPFLVCASLYLALTLAYSFRLKHVVVLDLMLLALGFVLRAVAGVWAIRAVEPDVALTTWFLACTFFLALFLAICKRRHELVLLDDQAQSHRPVLEDYSPGFSTR